MLNHPPDKVYQLFHVKNEKIGFGPDYDEFITVLQTPELMSLELVIIGIYGLYRKGKSYFMNQMIKCMDTSLNKFFESADSEEPITNGVLAKLVKYEKKLILLIDSEGTDAPSQINSKDDDFLLKLLYFLCSTLIINLEGNGISGQNLKSFNTVRKIIDNTVEDRFRVHTPSIIALRRDSTKNSDQPDFDYVRRIAKVATAEEKLKMFLCQLPIAAYEMKQAFAQDTIQFVNNLALQIVENSMNSGSTPRPSVQEFITQVEEIITLLNANLSSTTKQFQNCDLDLNSCSDTLAEAIKSHLPPNVRFDPSEKNIIKNIVDSGNVFVLLRNDGMDFYYNKIKVPNQFFVVLFDGIDHYYYVKSKCLPQPSETDTTTIYTYQYTYDTNLLVEKCYFKLTAFSSSLNRTFEAHKQAKILFCMYCNVPLSKTRLPEFESTLKKLLNSCNSATASTTSDGFASMRFVSISPFKLLGNICGVLGTGAACILTLRVAEKFSICKNLFSKCTENRFLQTTTSVVGFTSIYTCHEAITFEFDKRVVNKYCFEYKSEAFLLNVINQLNLLESQHYTFEMFARSENYVSIFEAINDIKKLKEELKHKYRNENEPLILICTDEKTEMHIFPDKFNDTKFRAPSQIIVVKNNFVRRVKDVQEFRFEFNYENEQYNTRYNFGLSQDITNELDNELKKLVPTKTFIQRIHSIVFTVVKNERCKQSCLALKQYIPVKHYMIKYMMSKLEAMCFENRNFEGICRYFDDKEFSKSAVFDECVKKIDKIPNEPKEMITRIDILQHVMDTVLKHCDNKFKYLRQMSLILLQCGLNQPSGSSCKKYLFVFLSTITEFMTNSPSTIGGLEEICDFIYCSVLSDHKNITSSVLIYTPLAPTYLQPCKIGKPQKDSKILLLRPNAIVSDHQSREIIMFDGARNYYSTTQMSTQDDYSTAISDYKPDFMLKVMIVGDRNVDKTSLWYLLKKQENPNKDNTSTFHRLNAEEIVFESPQLGKQYQLQLIDVPNNVLHNSEAMDTADNRVAVGIVVFDVTKANSFEETTSFIQILKQLSPKCKILVVGSNVANCLDYKILVTQEELKEMQIDKLAFDNNKQLCNTLFYLAEEYASSNSSAQNTTNDRNYFSRLVSWWYNK